MKRIVCTGHDFAGKGVLNVVFLSIYLISVFSHIEIMAVSVNSISGPVEYRPVSADDGSLCRAAGS
jgi:hypothetical protein